ncbi:putative valine--tRNA ligase, mitochondrial [Frankliniella fusca]|uniref:Valine--tRNA ligase, mitochondrial n=1 Tax=Frankliniella fusca TaxID=407009 RepID=A0AAE1I363_9NEOP|nr:putative valine--tRNA ligase, mitochondrial [Frankliniella fusca]
MVAFESKELLIAALCAALACAASASTVHAGSAEDGSANDLVVTYGSLPDPLHWLSFYSLPRTVQLAKKDGWAEVTNASAPELLAEGVATTWCRQGDYRVCLLFDAAGVVAGLQASVSVKDFDKSYPIAMETQWRRQTLLNTEVFSATALFVAPRILTEGGRKVFAETDNTVEALHLQNGISFWPMPSRMQDAKDVAFEKQGCVEGMGRHFFYGMKDDLACDEHRPFFLLFDDVTGLLHGFGVTLFGRPAAGSWFGRKWFEKPNRKLVSAMVPDGPACFADWAAKKGIGALHVYFKSSPWKLECLDMPPSNA